MRSSGPECGVLGSWGVGGLSSNLCSNAWRSRNAPRIYHKKLVPVSGRLPAGLEWRPSMGTVCVFQVEVGSAAAGTPGGGDDESDPFCVAADGPSVGVWAVLARDSIASPEVAHEQELLDRSAKASGKWLRVDPGVSSPG